MNLDFPEKLQPLFQPSRYKVLYGGRGGAKSWGVARALLLKGIEQKLAVLCTREFQNSIDESVHKLLSQQVTALGLEDHYSVLSNEIRGKNGTQFNYEGLRRNANKIRSYEGVDITWVEEANFVPKQSWDVLIPTIRKTGSEIWATFNPELDTDYTYAHFVKNTPPDTIKIEINWRDNPWFPDVLMQEMLHMRETDYDNYLTIWEGKTRATLEGAIYARELRQLVGDGRYTKVPYNPEYPVYCYWDLGWSDNTAIWFIQKCGFKYHAIDYLEDHARTITWYLKEIQDRGYVIGGMWLPHDAGARDIKTGKTVEEIVRKAGYATRVTQLLPVSAGINAVRNVFPNLYIDEDKCDSGFQALKRYRYNKNTDGTYSRQPVHDWTSHTADALRTFGVAANWGEGKPTDALQKIRRPSVDLEILNNLATGPNGWLT